MTIKTLFIAPYPAMSHLIEECRKEEPELEVRVEVGNLLEAVPLAKEGERQGYDVIISRGGTAKLIEPEVRIPVIDVHVSGYDIARAHLSQSFSRQESHCGLLQYYAWSQSHYRCAGYRG